MTESSVTAQLEALVGLRVMAFRLGEINALGLEFGRSDVPAGTARLETITASWRWESADRVLAGAGDLPEPLSSLLHGLIGLEVARVAVQQPSLSPRLIFTDGSRLSIFAVHTVGHLHWSLRTRDSGTVVVGPETSWSFDRD